MLASFPTFLLLLFSFFDEFCPFDVCFFYQTLSGFVHLPFTMDFSLSSFVGQAFISFFVFSSLI
jgi:hypothetical protein